MIDIQHEFLHFDTVCLQSQKSKNLVFSAVCKMTMKSMTDERGDECIKISHDEDGSAKSRVVHRIESFS